MNRLPRLVAIALVALALGVVALFVPPDVVAALAGGLAAGSIATRFWRVHQERTAWGPVHDVAAHLANSAGVPGPGSATPGEVTAALARTESRWSTSHREDQGSLAFARGALAAIAEPILVASGTGRVVLANPAMEELAGVRAGGAAGREIEDLLPASGLARVFEDALGGEGQSEQIVVRRGDGVRTWEVAARAGGDGKTVVMSFRDVTEASRVLKVRTDFVANASHELRTPIAAIRMALETLGSLEDGEGELRDRLLSMVGGQVSRLEELARDLLDLSRLESEAEVRRERVLTADLSGALRPRFEGVCSARKLTLEFDFAPELESLATDRRLLELILGNLIDNATKFAFEGTSVRVVGRPAGGGAVRLEVIDRGVGIPLEQQPRIFERFYQVDPSRSGERRGSGLGLAIVRHAVKRLGGTISLKSVWQQGTTMIVDLPGVVVR
jgi:two-component system, OmpR family, phosphate regulon sensor histidine kinase PhoR